MFSSEKQTFGSVIHSRMNTPSCFMTSATLAQGGRRHTNSTTTGTHRCAGASSSQDKAPAGPRPLRFREPHWPAFRPPSLLAPGIWHGRRACLFGASIGEILMTASSFLNFYWLLGLRMGGERQSDRAQGGKRGMRRRVVGDARPKVFARKPTVVAPPPRGFLSR